MLVTLNAKRFDVGHRVIVVQWKYGKSAEEGMIGYYGRVVGVYRGGYTDRPMADVTLIGRAQYPAREGIKLGTGRVVPFYFDELDHTD